MLKGKEKRYLRSLANTKNAIFQVGKDGVNENQCEGINSALETHELIKVSVLKSCSQDVREVAFDISASTNSEIVQIIGKTIVFYRRSKKNIIELP